MSLRDGCRKTFTAYLGQDLHYLTAFAEAYTAGLSKAAQVGPDAVLLIEELLKGVQDEICEIHANYAKVTKISFRDSPECGLRNFLGPCILCQGEIMILDGHLLAHTVALSIWRSLK